MTEERARPDVVLVRSVHRMSTFKDLGLVLAPEVFRPREMFNGWSCLQNEDNEYAREMAPEMLSMDPSIQPFGRARWIVPR